MSHETTRLPACAQETRQSTASHAVRLSVRASPLIIITMRPSDSVMETLAGGFAGFCQVVVGHPFDTVKVHVTQRLSASLTDTLIIHRCACKHKPTTAVPSPASSPSSRTKAYHSCASSSCIISPVHRLLQRRHVAHPRHSIVVSHHWPPSPLIIRLVYSNSVLFSANGLFKKHLFLPDVEAGRQLGSAHLPAISVLIAL